MKQQGFSIIEAIVYMGLFAIIIGSVLVATYSIIDTTNKTQGKVVRAEEVNFILRKLDWVLTNVTSITAPGSGVSATGATLVVNKSDVAAGQNPLTISLSGTTLQLQRGSSAALALSSSNSAVTALSFSHTVVAGMLESVTATFSISGQTYQTTKYLRK